MEKTPQEVPRADEKSCAQALQRELQNFVEGEPIVEEEEKDFLDSYLDDLLPTDIE